ncbi:CRISPR-associated helicase Cas3' [Chelativorans sp. Marseille-P2723]|uniref:CRISPR-associated helicase Cas3' n=1 Tax=Chelativorans sp. Marseille-P2723 TaxID=2709133 RepID=UPI00156E1934|nr:CRISPR-associated helicase Cas3' [Chelativorans sp. Marseille-P2723]
MTVRGDGAAPWGKAAAAGKHHLAHHCADVAACFEAICALPVVRARLERVACKNLKSLDIARLSALVFLHDCGKLHPGFQAKFWPQGIWHDCWMGHLEAGAAIFSFAARETKEIARALNIEALGAWGVDHNLLYAVLAHHGRPFKMDAAARNGWRKVEAIGYDPLASAEELGRAMRLWFELAFSNGGEPLPARPDFQHLLCGLVILADWLGSTERIFSYVPDFDSDYWEKARNKAREAIRRVGLDTEQLRATLDGRADFSTLTGGYSPRPAQEAMGTVSLDEQLVILEAETGSGKTEAALWHFTRLFEAGRVGSLYFALPTRAAAKQIHGRVHEAMQRLFGDGAPEPVLAVPGYFKAGEHEGQALPNWRVLWDDDGGVDERLLLSRWAAESTKRYLAATVAVGTVDQAMLAGLQVKHAHLRGAALARSLLVIDEIHASDRYMSEVQSHLLKMHLQRGGFAMLMSATLGSVARVQWLTQRRRATEPSFEMAVSTPYPAIWGMRSHEPDAPPVDGREKHVAISLAPSWSAEEAARHAVEAANAGAKVLVIRNTVAAALATFQAVQVAGGTEKLWKVNDGPALHHSRFAPEDRRLLDEAVEEALSPKREKRPSGGLIVIGTQTLEQSLDIDADMLITDLCPADVLLQRIGRLHRHAVPRLQGFEAPCCVVLAPEGGLDYFTAPKFENGLGMFKSGGGVYQNLHACELTRRLIIDHPEWVIPRMNRLLVESATHPEKIGALNEELGSAWADYWNDVYGAEIAAAGSARNVALPTDKAFINESGNPLLFVSDEQAIRTRLGAEGARVHFTEGVVGPFGRVISGVTLPAHWSKHILPPEELITPERVGGKLCFGVGDTEFSYDRDGLERVRS